MGELKKSPPYGDSSLALVKCFGLGDVSSRRGRGGCLRCLPPLGTSASRARSVEDICSPSLHTQAIVVFFSLYFKAKAKHIYFYPERKSCQI